MQIADNVLAVLSELQFNGTNAVITGQLDRKLYVKVNEVLEACGGKWNRKAKAHVFPIDAAELVGRAIASGVVVTASEMGFFATPAPIAAQLVEDADVRPEHSVLEPSAGNGVIIDALLDLGFGPPFNITAIELDRERNERMRKFYASLSRFRKLVTVQRECDFLNYEPDEPFDRVVMNPPFGKVGKGDHLDHVDHAFSMLDTGGILVSVLPQGVVFREDKRHKAFRKKYTSEHGSIIELLEGSFKSSGTDVRTCVLKVVKL